MIKTLIIALVLLGFVAGLWWFRRSRAASAPHAEKAKVTLDNLPLPEGPNWGTCQKCGERRVIINAKAGLCAVCWSASGTRPLG